MEVPQLDPIPRCPQRCQDVFTKLNDSLQEAGNTLAEYDEDAAERQEAVDFRDRMIAEGKRNPEAEAKLDRALRIGEAATLEATEEIMRMEAPIRAINSMASCALSGCKVIKGSPLVEAARENIT